jgi:hypothetical protein
MSDHYVEVRRLDNDELVKRWGPFTDYFANRVANSADNQADHSAVYVCRARYEDAPNPLGETTGTWRAPVGTGRTQLPRAEVSGG